MGWWSRPGNDVLTQKTMIMLSLLCGKVGGVKSWWRDSLEKIFAGSNGATWSHGQSNPSRNGSKGWTRLDWAIRIPQNQLTVVTIIAGMSSYFGIKRHFYCPFHPMLLKNNMLFKKSFLEKVERKQEMKWIKISSLSLTSISRSKNLLLLCWL